MESAFRASLVALALTISTGCGGSPPASPTGPAGDLPLQVAVTSSTLRVSWEPPPRTGQARIYLAAEPSSATDGTLPDQLLIATLPAGSSSHTIEGLAPGCDAFVRVVLDGAGDAPRWGNAHARTLGGPRAPLDTALREVQAYGPRVLSVVLANPGTVYSSDQLQGNLGVAWQGGTWSLQRRDGSPIGIVAVHRSSYPVGQPHYEVGFNQLVDDNTVDVDHRIFLTLDQPLGQRDLLRLAHSGADGTELEALIPFSDRYLETPLIQVNQVGYNPRATRRWAYVSGWMGDGGPASLSSLPGEAEVLVEPLDPLRPREAAVSGLPIELRAESDPSAGGEVREIDLAQVPPAEGVRYRVRIPGVGVSWPTAVSEEAAFRAFFLIARGLYHNRWCGDLDPKYTEWSRPPDHCSAYFVEGRSYLDGFFDPATSQGDPRPLRGGHHDAGDFDIRPFHVTVAQQLMRAYELAPSRYPDGQLLIPESGNGIPDLLDEALWSVAAWEQLQNPDGGVRAGVESSRHPLGIYTADEDQLAYWTYDPEVWHTAYVSGLFAQAAYLVRPFDPQHATRLEEAARKAYDWAESRGAAVEYLLYGAGELTRLTGEDGYAQAYQSEWSAIDKYGRGAFDNIQTADRIYPGVFTSYTPAMADFVIGYATSSSPSPAITSVTIAQLTEKATAAARRVLESAHAHRNGRPDNVAVDWGGLTSTGRHVDMIYQRLQLGDLPASLSQDYFDAMSLSADYVLGCNPLSYSFVTGLGTRFPQEPLHLDSLALIKKRGLPPIPGIPVYGPVTSYPGQFYYRPQGAAFFPAFDQQPLAMRIADTRASVNMNEFDVASSQAPLTLLFAALLGEGMTPPDAWKPGAAGHRATLPSHTHE